jgi:hypothetical protein
MEYRTKGILWGFLAALHRSTDRHAIECGVSLCCQLILDSVFSLYPVCGLV